MTRNRAAAHRNEPPIERQPVVLLPRGVSALPRYDAHMTPRIQVAVTGGDGRIGGILRNGLSDRFAPRWLSRSDADVTDLAALERAFAGADAVVHLAADADAYASWDEVLPANVIGAHHVFEAARRAGVGRVVFASSNHAMGMYMWDDDRFADDAPAEVTTDAPLRPDGLYGSARPGARRSDGSMRNGTGSRWSASASAGSPRTDARRRARR